MQMTDNLEKRLRRLEDREEIRTLAARYTFAVDNRDLPEIEKLFAAGARFRSRDGVMNAVGREAIMAQFEGRFAALGPGAHYSHDHVVWFEAGDENAAFGLLSSHAELIRNNRPMIASLRYEDEYVREAGRWKFNDRLLSFFYYLNTADYLNYLANTKRMCAYETPQDADFPEALSSWRDYHRKP